MDSKLREPAMMVAGGGLLYGDFFDLYDVAAAFDIPSAQAVQLMNYLRTSDWVDKAVKVRRGLREEGKAPKRIFIKVLCIHQGALHSSRAGPQVREGPVRSKVEADSAAADKAGEVHAFTAGSSLIEVV